MQPVDRRTLLKSAIAAGAAAEIAMPATARYEGKTGHKPTGEELDRAAARPVLKRELFKEPVIIESMTLMKLGADYLVRVRAKGGAEGMSVCNASRPEFLDKIFKGLIAPFFVGKDARDLDNLLWELYRFNSNYKMYGLAFWSPQAWAEFAILDLLGRVVNKPMGELIGDIVRREVAFYAASGRRDTTPQQEVEYLQKLVQQSGAKAVKFRLGGRMSRNADSIPGRTEALIPLVRKTFGAAIDIHGDANSSYDVPNAVRVGRILEEHKAVYYEEPCQFDHFDEIKAVRDKLAIPVAAGEQEYSDWRFRWAVLNRGVDIVQPDLFYYGGMVRSVRVARMAKLADMPTTVHISGGFGFVYMLHFSSCVPDIGKYQEYKLGTEKYGKWFDPVISVKDGKMTIPQGPGVGVRDIGALLREAKAV
jgi:L-alanine-DL-glutamate epimerase-like enolase superfamily enzyme